MRARARANNRTKLAASALQRPPTSKGAESTASLGAVGRTERTLAANGPDCESRCQLGRANAVAMLSESNVIKGREAGRCQPRKATSGSAGCAGAC